MQKSTRLLSPLLVVLLATIHIQTICIRKREPLNPYIDINIRQTIIYTLYYFSMLANLNSKFFFKKASQQEIADIKQIAEQLNINKQKIKNLRVKKPQKYTLFDRMFTNNLAALENTVIIGNQQNESFARALQDPYVKKFAYAHELSHIKYNHSTKSFLSFIILPIITHYGIKTFNYLYGKVLKSINLYKMPYNTRVIIKNFPTILDSPITKYVAQMLLLTSIRKKFEKNADLSAATLGPNTIRGGIKLLQIFQNNEKKYKKAIMSQYKGSIFKYVMSFYLSVKHLLRKIFNFHPSHKVRIRYLQKLLKK